MRMDIVDRQVHIGKQGYAPILAQMDALGIQSATLSELWSNNWEARLHPGYELPGDGGGGSIPSRSRPRSCIRIGFPTSYRSTAGIRTCKA